MQLEDHAGDVVRKACERNHVPAAAAAAAAGLAEPELAGFYRTGRCAKEINFTALAPLAGLDPRKLEALAGGWLPAPRDLSRWRQLRVFTTKNDELSVNCFLAWDESARTAALFDTGLEARPVLEVIAAGGLRLEEIFITHSHWDHVGALPQFRAAFPKARLHSGSKRAPAAQRNQPGEIIQLGRLRITHRDTPGHAEDGVTYLVDLWPDAAPAVAVVGDAIFAGSMGNGNGAWELAKQKVQEQILSLPAETLICPGHGPLTTVAEEKENNPFF